MSTENNLEITKMLVLSTAHITARTAVELECCKTELPMRVMDDEDGFLVSCTALPFMGPEKEAAVPAELRAAINIEFNPLSFDFDPATLVPSPDPDPRYSYALGYLNNEGSTCHWVGTVPAATLAGAHEAAIRAAKEDGADIADRIHSHCVRIGAPNA